MTSNHPPGVWVLIRSNVISMMPVNGVPLRANQWHLLPDDQRPAVEAAAAIGGAAYSQYSVEIWPVK